MTQTIPDDPRIHTAIDEQTKNVETVIQGMKALNQKIAELECIWWDYPEQLRQKFPEHVRSFFEKGETP